MIIFIPAPGNKPISVTTLAQIILAHAVAMYSVYVETICVEGIRRIQTDRFQSQPLMENFLRCCQENAKVLLISSDQRIRHF